MTSPDSTPLHPQTPLARRDPISQRYANVDRLRLLALADIVYYHVAQAHFLNGLGLPIFLLFTAALNARPPRDPDPRRFVKRKFAAFLVPWAAWSVVYGLFLTAAMIHRGSNAFLWFEPVMLFLGTQWHLWYMIFGLVASLFAFFARRYTARVDDRLIIMLASLLGCAVMIPERMFADPPARAAAWLLSIPSIPIGIALGRCLWVDDLRTRIRNTALTLALVVAGMSVLELQDRGYSSDRYMAAMIPVCIAVLWRGVPDALTTWLTGLRLGVYLIHPLLVRATLSLFGGQTHLAVRTVVVIIASIAAVWLISKSPLRWMVQTGAIGQTKRPGPTPALTS